MKLTFKLMLLALMLVVVSPFLLHGPNGKPILSWEKLNLPDFSSLFGRANTHNAVKTIEKIKSSASDALPVETDDDTTAIHKWVDKQGVWHFSDKQNPEGHDEVVRINTNRNVVQATPVAKDIPDEEETRTAANGKEDKKEDGPDIPFPTTVPMKDIPKLINDTKALKETMDKRYKEQQKLLDSLKQPQ